MTDKVNKKKIKWQLHAETSATSILLWIIIGKLFGGWVWGLSAFMIFGNITTLIKSIKHLGSDYYKHL